MKSLAELQAIRDKMRQQIDLRDSGDDRIRVKDIKNIKIYGDFSVKERGPIVSVNLGNYSSSSVSDELFERFEIATRSGGHCAPLMHKALGTEKQGAVRFSFSYFNTEDEVLFAAKALKILGEE